MEWDYYPPYVPVAERRARALREVLKLNRKGTRISPVKIVGRTIASTFWGKAWCDNLESYSDFSNRLPRGRTYVRNGSVVDLQIEPGKVTSLVSGSSLYRITIQIRPLDPPCWNALKTECGSQIGSLVELLKGRLSKSVMEIVTRRESGLFPAPQEIEMSCSCPDWADMCKHIAATLYAVGSRLDHEPELFFKLRQVDHLELIAQAGSPLAGPKAAGRKKIATDQLAGVFGIELEVPEETTHPVQTAKPARNSKPTAPEKKGAARTRTAKPKAESQSASKRKSNERSQRPGAKKRKPLSTALTKRQKTAQETSQSTGKAATATSLPVPVKKAVKRKPEKLPRSNAK